jgi:hypothetical protein
MASLLVMALQMGEGSWCLTCWHYVHLCLPSPPAPPPPPLPSRHTTTTTTTTTIANNERRWRQHTGGPMKQPSLLAAAGTSWWTLQSENLVVDNRGVAHASSETQRVWCAMPMQIHSSSFQYFTHPSIHAMHLHSFMFNHPFVRSCAFMHALFISIHMPPLPHTCPSQAGSHDHLPHKLPGGDWRQCG